jgi:hypothetical protein
MKTIHPEILYTPPRGGVYPSNGVRGKVEVRGRSPRKKNFLVNVYCNFIVNLYCSLEGRSSDGRSYVRFFFRRMKPSFMRELYCGCVSLRILYYERGHYERKKRKL